MSFRRGRALKHVSTAAKALVRPALNKRGFSEPRILTEWDSVVGASLAGLARPLRMSFAAREGMGGTLTIGVLGSRAVEAQHMIPQIAERVNGYYGHRAISRVKIEQIGAEAFEAATQKEESPAPCPEMRARLAEPISSVRDEGLRSALERLGDNIALHTAAKAAEKEMR